MSDSKCDDNDDNDGKSASSSSSSGSSAAAVKIGQEMLIDGSFEQAKVGDNTWSHQASVGGWKSDSEIETWGKVVKQAQYAVNEVCGHGDRDPDAVEECSNAKNCIAGRETDGKPAA